MTRRLSVISYYVEYKTRRLTLGFKVITFCYVSFLDGTIISTTL
jgi:hypothetical protein